MHVFSLNIMLKWHVLEVKMLGSLRLVKLYGEGFFEFQSLENAKFLKVVFGHLKVLLSRAFDSQGGQCVEHTCAQHTST